MVIRYSDAHGFNILQIHSSTFSIQPLLAACNAGCFLSLDESDMKFRAELKDSFLRAKGTRLCQFSIFVSRSKRQPLQKRCICHGNAKRCFKEFLSWINHFRVGWKLSAKLLKNIYNFHLIFINFVIKSFSVFWEWYKGKTLSLYQKAR